MSKRLINLITLLIVLGGVFYGYRYFFVTPAVTETAGVSVTSSTDPQSSNGEFLDLLLSVKNLSLTKALFDNPVFRDRLQDYGRPLPERTIGRENPFAPIGVGGSGTTTTVSTSATSTKPTTATSTKATATTTPKAKTTSAPAKSAPPSDAELNQLNQDLNNLDSTNFSF